MSKLQKSFDKLLDPQRTFTFHDLEYLLGKLGYIEKKTGKTSGTRKAYINKTSLHIIRIHKPHPEKEIKRYVKIYLIRELRKQGLI